MKFVNIDDRERLLLTYLRTNICSTTAARVYALKTSRNCILFNDVERKDKFTCSLILWRFYLYEISNEQAKFYTCKTCYGTLPQEIRCKTGIEDWFGVKSWRVFT
jgi:hypothetical protein